MQIPSYAMQSMFHIERHVHRKSLHKITVALSIEQQQPCKLYHWLA